MKAEGYLRRRETLEGWEVEITTYRIGDTCHCHVDNVSPGATVARGEGTTVEEAERIAIEKARPRMAATRRVPR